MDGDADSRPSIVVPVLAYVAAQCVVNVEDARLAVQARVPDLSPIPMVSRVADHRAMGVSTVGQPLVSPRGRPLSQERTSRGGIWISAPSLYFSMILANSCAFFLFFPFASMAWRRGAKT